MLAGTILLEGDVAPSVRFVDGISGDGMDPARFRQRASVVLAFLHAGENPSTGGGGGMAPSERNGAARRDEDLDVRLDPPGVRHGRIFGAFAALPPGRAFVLVNDHDPKPLRYQFEAEHAGTFSWEPLEEGPEVWRIRIARLGADV